MTAWKEIMFVIEYIERINRLPSIGKTAKAANTVDETKERKAHRHQNKTLPTSAMILKSVDEPNEYQNASSEAATDAIQNRKTATSATVLKSKSEPKVHQAALPEVVIGPNQNQKSPYGETPLKTDDEPNEHKKAISEAATEVTATDESEIKRMKASLNMNGILGISCDFISTHARHLATHRFFLLLSHSLRLTERLSSFIDYH